MELFRNDALKAVAAKGVGSRTQSMLPALRELKPDMLNGRLAHGDHPVLLTTARPTRSSTA